MAKDDQSLQPTENRDNLGAQPNDFVLVPRKDLEEEHRVLLRRIHKIREQLGYAPLLTSKEARRRGQSA